MQIGGVGINMKKQTISLLNRLFSSFVNLSIFLFFAGLMIIFTYHFESEISRLPGILKIGFALGMGCLLFKSVTINWLGKNK